MADGQTFSKKKPTKGNIHAKSRDMATINFGRKQKVLKGVLIVPMPMFGTQLDGIPEENMIFCEEAKYQQKQPKRQKRFKKC